MSNIVTATVTIKGVRPILWHKFGPEALPLDGRKEKVGVAGHNPEEWRSTVLVTKQGQLFVEATYVFGMMRDAAKYTKRGRSSIMKHMAATLQIVEDRVLVDRWFPGFPDAAPLDLKTIDPPPQDPDLPVYMDCRGVVNPNTRSRNVRYRVAASPGWRMTFDLLFDKTIVSSAEMHAVAIDAGRLVGLGNGRSIGFGRFEVETFEAAD